MRKFGLLLVFSLFLFGCLDFDRPNNIFIDQNVSGDTNLSDQNFLNLRDTPGSYSGQTTLCVVVNGDENGLVFSFCGAGSLTDTTLDLNADALASFLSKSYDWNADQNFLQVNVIDLNLGTDFISVNGLDFNVFDLNVSVLNQCSGDVNSVLTSAGLCQFIGGFGVGGADSNCSVSGSCPLIAYKDRDETITGDANWTFTNLLIAGSIFPFSSGNSLGSTLGNQWNQIFVSENGITLFNCQVGSNCSDESGFFYLEPNAGVDQNNFFIDFSLFKNIVNVVSDPYALILYDEGYSRRWFVDANGNSWFDGNVSVDLNLFVDGNTSTECLFFEDGTSLCSFIPVVDTNAATGCDSNQVLLGGSGGCVFYELGETFLPDTVLTVSGTDSNNNDVNAIRFYDLNSYTVDEDSGANPLQVDVNFSDVNSFDSISFRQQYLGGAGHEVIVELYDYDDLQWEEYAEITDQGSFVVSNIPVYDDSMHILDGNVSVRFRHEQSGIPTHVLLIDFVWLIKGTTTGVTSEHDALSGRDSNSNHPWALDKDTAALLYWNQTDLNSLLQIPDFNNVWVSWIDANLTYWSQSDLNALLQITDFNEVYVSWIDANQTFWKQVDLNAVLQVSDFNKVYSSWKDANQTFWIQSDLNSLLQIPDFNNMIINLGEGQGWNIVDQNLYSIGIMKKDTNSFNIDLNAGGNSLVNVLDINTSTIYIQTSGDMNFFVFDKNVIVETVNGRITLLPDLNKMCMGNDTQFCIWNTDGNGFIGWN